MDLLQVGLLIIMVCLLTVHVKIHKNCSELSYALL